MVYPTNPNKNAVSLSPSDDVSELLLKLKEQKLATRAAFSRTGRNPAKAKLLTDAMHVVHDLLQTTTQAEILEYLSEHGLPVSRPTLRRLYLAWARQNSEIPRIAAKAVAKKSAQASGTKIPESVMTRFSSKPIKQ